MTASWYLAKAIPDLHRNEPVNVGLIVQDGDRVGSRFLGFAEDGALRKQSIPRWIDNDVYLSWVNYYRRHASSEPLDRVIDRRLSRIDPFYVERRGVVLENVAPDELDGFVNRMFASLVERRDSLASTVDLRSEVDRLVNSLPVGTGQFTHNFELDVEDRGIDHRVHFDWRFNGSKPTLIDGVKIGQRSQEQAANDFLFRITLAGMRNIDRFVALHLPAADEPAEVQLQRIEHYAHTIDVTRPTAKTDLAAALGIGHLDSAATSPV